MSAKHDRYPLDIYISSTCDILSDICDKVNLLNFRKTLNQVALADIL